MKATIIRSTVLVLAVLAISVGVKAQSAQQYSADVPFDFEARGKHYAAGEYRLASMSRSSPGVIGIVELKSGKASILGTSQDPGTGKWDKPGTLTFLKVNGRYLLSEISTATMKLRMKEAKTAIRDVDNAAIARIVKLH